MIQGDKESERERITRTNYFSRECKKSKVALAIDTIIEIKKLIVLALVVAVGLRVTVTVRFKPTIPPLP